MDIIDEAKEDYKIADEGWRDIYEAAREDVKFTYDIDDGQWDTDTLRQRKNRPCITVNKLQKFVRQSRGDFAMNRPSMKVIPVDDKADVQMAELYNAILRQIEYTSNAPVVYDTAYAYALSSSIGFYRIVTEYSDENSFEQDIKIKRIVNPLSVRLDPFAKEFSYEDGRFGFVDDLISEEDYKKLYPKSKVISFEGNKNDALGEWIQDGKIKVSEYFKKESHQKKIGLVSDGQIIVLDKDNIARVNAAGQKIIREREVTYQIVKWYKINGVEVLEETEWAGSQIPLIPMLGDESLLMGNAIIFL